MKLKDIVDFLLPRFRTEECALIYYQGSYRPFCPMSEVRDHERFDAIGVVSSFGIFGVGFFPMIDAASIRPWDIN